MEEKKKTEEPEKKVDREALKRMAVYKLMALGTAFVMCVILMLYLVVDKPTQAELTVIRYAREQGISALQYPEELIKVLEKEPKAEEFVLNYPDYRDRKPEIHFTNLDLIDGVPPFMLYDERWGYMIYGDRMVCTNGSGPLCLSMVGYYLTEDASFHPDRIVKFADDNGFSIPGAGTKRTLISVGGRALGLDVTKLAKEESKVADYLGGKIPLVAVVRGDIFGDGDHFIVLKGYNDGRVDVIDPASYGNSREWEFKELAGMIQELWVVRKGE